VVATGTSEVVVTGGVEAGTDNDDWADVVSRVFVRVLVRGDPSKWALVVVGSLLVFGLLTGVGMIACAVIPAFVNCWCFSRMSLMTSDLNTGAGAGVIGVGGAFAVVVEVAAAEAAWVGEVDGEMDDKDSNADKAAAVDLI